MIDIDQLKARVREEVARRGLTSFMNDTKWRELQRVVREELPFEPPYQLKDVLQPEPYPATFDADVWYLGDWVEGILPFFSIEWIRIRPRHLKQQFGLIAPSIVDCEAALKAALERHHIPFVARDDSIWIFGYAAQTPM